MIRNLLATTAIATLVATGAAMAQTTTPTAPLEAAPQPQVKHAEGYLASNLIGETVYNGTGPDAANIGQVKDLVLDAEGNIQAIVVGVGGFLGIGAKQVALEYDLVEWAELDGNEYIVVETSREALEALEEFDVAAYEMQPADAEVGNTKPATADDLSAAPATEQGGEMTDEMGAAPTDEGAAPADDMAATDEPATDDMAAAPADEDTAAPADEGMAATDEAAPADEEMAADEEAAPAEDDMAAAPADEEMAETDETQTSAIDRSSLTEVPTGDIRAEDFVGTTVYGANDENIGEIGDVILTEDGAAEAVIIDVGGFLGIGEKEVAVSMDNLAFLSDADGEYYLYTTLTQEQLEAQAAYDEATFAENRDDQLMMTDPVQ